MFNDNDNLIKIAEANDENFQKVLDNQATIIQNQKIMDEKLEILEQ